MAMAIEPVPWSRQRRAALAVLLLAALSPGGNTGADMTPGDIWAGVEVGAGNARSTTDATHSDSTWYLSFKGGFAFSERLLLGMEIGGFTLEAGDLWDSSEGEGITQVFVTGQYYFARAREGWYAKGGGGYVSYWNNRPGGVEDTGWGATLGLGYDWRAGGFGTLGPVISFSYGKAGALDHQAVALALSWAFP